MKIFLGIYLGTASTREASGWDAMDDKKRQELEEAGMKAWGDWMATNQSAIVESGGPLGKTKRISRQGIADVSNQMVGYVVLEAESHEAAAKKFEGHPHFSIFPGDAVEVMECLPIPGMPEA